MAKMDLAELQSIILRELDQAIGADGSKLSVNRRAALQYYEGEPFGNEMDGRSQVVMRTVLEVVEWVLPALLRIFTASDNIIEIEPRRPDQEAIADQATEYINYIMHKDNAGFLILHDWFKDALISKVGWVKVFWDTQKEQEVNTYTGLSEQEYAALKTPDAKIIEERSYPATQNWFDYDDPDTTVPTLYDCTLRVTREEGRVKIEPVPPEEVLVSRRAKTVDELPFIAHRREWTVTDLLEQGFDEDSIEEATGQNGPQFNTEAISRYLPDDDFPFATERTDDAMRAVWVDEVYLRVDYNGDGIAELCKITTGSEGRVILTRKGKPDIEEVDEVPLIPITPIPMPHKLVGMSVADLVMDLQLIKSTLVRQILDGNYLAIAPRTVVGRAAVNENTYDDLLTVRPGGLIRAEDPAAIIPLPTTFNAEGAMQVIEYIDQTTETRTGISRRNQGLAPDDINKTAASVNALQQAAAQRVELIARVFGDTGVKILGERILGLITKYQQHERIIRITGKPLSPIADPSHPGWSVPLDPRQWRNQMDVSVSVGLGTGNRDQILGHLMQILQTQQQIVQVQQGVNGPLVTAKNVFDVLELLTENAGFKQSFFTDPREQQQGGGAPGQQQPDPKMMQAHADVQAAQMKAQVDAQMQQQRLQADLEAQKQKAALDAQLKQHDAQLQMQLDQQRSQHQMQLEEMRMQAKFALDQREIELRAQAGAYTSGPAPQQGAG